MALKKAHRALPQYVTIGPIPIKSERKMTIILIMMVTWTSVSRDAVFQNISTGGGWGGSLYPLGFPSHWWVHCQSRMLD